MRREDKGFQLLFTLFPTQFYGFIGYEDEGNNGKKSGKEEREGFLVESVTGVKSATTTLWRNKENYRDNRDIPKSEFFPREINAFFEEIERDEREKGCRRKEK